MSRPAPLLLFAFALGAVVSAGQSAPQGLFTIGGTVTASSSGDVLRHARVSATAAAGGVPATLSDDRGRYTLNDLVPGRYVLAIAKPGYVRQTIPVDVPLRHSDSVDIQMIKGAVVSGAIIDELGEPVASVSVTIRAVKAASDVIGGPIVAVAQTDDLGQFRASGIAPGSYVVEVTPGLLRSISEDGASMEASTGPRMGRRIFYPGVADPSAAQRLTMSQRRTVGHRHGGAWPPRRRRTAFASGRWRPDRMRPRRSKASRQAGRLRLRRWVNATLMNGRPSTATSPSDADGNFELVVSVAAPSTRGAEPPAFRITAFKTGYQSADYGQRSPTTRGDPIQLAPGESREHVDVTMQPLGIVSGRILDDVGEPVEGALVRPVQVRYINGRRQLVDVGAPRRTDDLGRYRLFGLRSGQYAVSAAVGQIVVTQPSVELPGFGTTYYPGTSDPQAIQFVRVNPSQEVSAVDFSLVRMRSARIAAAPWTPRVIRSPAASP
jgi:protocatechuate 3,4-dioxygenase beta subunit